MSGAVDDHRVESLDQEEPSKQAEKEPFDDGVAAAEEGDKKEVEHGEDKEEPAEDDAQGSDEEEANGEEETTSKGSSSLSKKIYRVIVKQVLPGMLACLTKEVGLLASHLWAVLRCINDDILAAVASQRCPPIDSVGKETTMKRKCCVFLLPWQLRGCCYGYQKLCYKPTYQGKCTTYLFVLTTCFN